MTEQKRVVFWDFDGTLVHFTPWRIAVMDVLDECEAGHCVDTEQISPFLRDGFPWHKPEEHHTHFRDPDDWWQALEPVFLRCYKGLGYTDKRAQELAGQVHQRMTKPERFILYEDTIPVLKALKQKGWRNVILSNHMPELPDIVDALGLANYVDFCITSGITGYEKPNPRAFFHALEVSDHPETVWMVGDNAVSDVKGAEATGIPAILVRVPEVAGVKYYAADLAGAVKIIEGTL